MTQDDPISRIQEGVRLAKALREQLTPADLCRRYPMHAILTLNHERRAAAYDFLTFLDDEGILRDRVCTEDDEGIESWAEVEIDRDHLVHKFLGSSLEAYKYEHMAMIQEATERGL